MAKAKKKESTLTLEEKLAQALVPESEQPYKVPKNWCWVRLGVLGYTNIGLTYKPSDVSEQGIIVLRSVNIQNGAMYYDDVVKVDLNISKEKMSQKGDILICARNGSKSLVGKSAIIDRDGMSYGAFMAIFRSEYNKYIYYFLNSIYFRNIIDRNVGTTTINQVTQQLIKELEFPLAPLSEQQRIVERIESLFAKLDEAKEKLQAVLDSFETRKAAIMHKAFTGELTAKWRKENGISLDSWEKKKLGDITDIVSSKRIYKEEYVEKGIPFFRSSEVVELNDKGFTEPKYFVSENRYDEIKEKYGVPEKGDMLVTSVGTIGKTWIVDDRDFYYKDGNLTQIKQCTTLDMRFLQLFIKSEGFNEQIIDSVSGSAYNALTIVKFKKIFLNLPCITEQKEIVRIVNAVLKREQNIRNIVGENLERVEFIKKAIVARAFRGELGTNDENDECAVELLKRVL